MIKSAAASQPHPNPAWLALNETAEGLLERAAAGEPLPGLCSQMSTVLAEVLAFDEEVIPGRAEDEVDGRTRRWHPGPGGDQ